jgi:L-fuculose-phosphate aldolase
VTDAPLVTHTIPESYVVLRDVPKLPFARIVEDAAEITNRISPTRHPVILIENEGVVAVGRTLLEAFDRLEVLEATAEALLLSRPLGSLASMPQSALDELRSVFSIP